MVQEIFLGLMTLNASLATRKTRRKGQLLVRKYLPTNAVADFLLLCTVSKPSSASLDFFFSPVSMTLTAPKLLVAFFTSLIVDVVEVRVGGILGSGLFLSGILVIVCKALQ